MAKDSGKESQANKIGQNNTGAAGRGRPKGSANKTTLAVKEALTEAFDKLGGTESLVLWASENQTEFYKLWAKLLPTDVNHSGNVTLTHEQWIGQLN